MSISITIHPTNWNKPTSQEIIRLAEAYARQLSYSVCYELLEWSGRNPLDAIDPAIYQPLLIGFDFEDVATGTFLGSIDFSCTWIDNEVPHPLQQQDLELWGDEYTGHPVLDIEGSASASLIELARWVPYIFHFEGIRLGTGAHRVARCALIAAVSDICGGLIYSHDGGLPPESNGLPTEEFLHEVAKP